MEIEARDTVLQHDAKLDIDMSTAKKLAYCWIGPYCVKEAILEKGTYMLKEFDRTPIPRTHMGNQLKKFVKRKGFYEPVSLDIDREEEESQSGESLEQDLKQSTTTDQLELMDFKIILPQLTAEQQQKYVQYKKDNEGNIL